MEPESERMVAELRQFLGADEPLQRKSREILGLCLGRSMLTAFAKHGSFRSPALHLGKIHYEHE